MDEIGYEEDSIAALIKTAGLSRARVVTYEHPVTLMSVLLGSSQAQAAANPWKMILEASVPKAMFYCSWFPPLQ